jgi:anti-sigma factor RsiW
LDEEFSQADLEAYLDEALAASEMAAIEDALRKQPVLAEKLVAIHGRRDAGVHTLGEIWRRHRLTCPSREELTRYLDGKLPEDEADYVKFHLEQVHCRLCNASFADIGIQRQATDKQSASRHQRLLDRSSNYLRKKK